MQKVRVLIVEDEFITLDALRDTLEDIGYEISGDAMRAKDALLILDKGQTDIAILDIHLKGSQSGIWLATQIRDKYKIPFIFLSAFSDKKTIEEAAQTKPSSYLVKPFTPADLYTSIEVALRTYTEENESAQLTEEDGDEAEKFLINDSIYIKHELTYKKINIRDIRYIESFKNYIELHLANERHVIRSTLKDFFSALPTEYFMQIHRSYVINIEHIEELAAGCVRIAGQMIPFSRSQKEELLKRLKLYS